MVDFVFGLNQSGIAVAQLLIKLKKNFHCWDDNKKLRDVLIKKFPKLKFKKVQKNNINKYNNFFLTPGVSLIDKRFKDIPKHKFKRDLNLYYQNIYKEKIVAITGTNGKSTTTKLVGEILKKKYKKTFIGGNIGDALCNAFLKKIKFTHHVLELSSFQLETIKNFEPNISILINLSKDHLDRYRNFKEYIFTKKNIFNYNSDNLNIISYDDKFSRRILANKKIKNKISFSINNSNADVFYKEGYIIDKYFHNTKKIRLFNISLDLNSNYNFQNIIVSYIVCKILKVPNKYFISGVQKFKGLPFRSTVIHNSSKKLIINNSKATNISSSISSLTNRKNIFLILGGVAKETGFEKFRKFQKDINKIYIFGKSRYLIYKEINLKNLSKKFINLNELINILWEDSRGLNEKVTILFSPACASFDQFENFEKRGEYFNKLIFNKIKNEN